MINKKYRVECNYGSKYFNNAVDAFWYYRKKAIQYNSTYIYLCTIEKTKNRFSIVQELLDYTEFPSLYHFVKGKRRSK